MSRVEVVSGGFLHGVPPEAHVVLDLRHHFRDPHVSPKMRYMTARDAEVAANVLDTPGITRLIGAAVSMVAAFLDGPGDKPVVVAVLCAGGRHRAPVVAKCIARRLEADGVVVDLSHRDLHREVVDR